MNKYKHCTILHTYDSMSYKQFFLIKKKTHLSPNNNNNNSCNFITNNLNYIFRISTSIYIGVFK